MGWFSKKSKDKPEAEHAADDKASATPPPEEDHAAQDDVAPSAQLSEPEQPASQAQTSSAATQAPVEDGQNSQEAATKQGLFSRLAKGLRKTGSTFTDGVGELLLGKKEIDDDLLEELETLLITADLGMEATAGIVENLTSSVRRKEVDDPDALLEALQRELRGLLEPHEAPLVIDASKKPFVVLMVGVNGVGKTTTIGKLAKRYQQQGLSVMLAAGDTFRAAAVEQLQVWGERNNVPVVAQHTGADSASVLYDALEAAKARQVDVLIADTAGRLHNKSQLMDELKKVVRVLGKIDEQAPHEVMLVLDAGTGQNALSQAKHFQEDVGVTGLTLTKLDGTAKGGIIFAIGKQLDLPIRYIGVGEQVDDLREFKAKEFVSALFAGSSLDG